MAATAAIPGGADALIEHLARLRARGSRQRLLRRSEPLHARATVERLTDEVARRVHADLDEAERLAEAASWIADKLGDDYARARSIRAQGNVLFSRGAYAKALEHYQQAIDLFHGLGESLETARTHNSTVQTLIYLGQYEDALANAEAARTVFARAGDRLRVARVDSNVANVYYRLDRFPEALALYRRAHEEFRAVGTPADVAVAVRNMAVCHISLNQFQDALRLHRWTRLYCRRHGLPLLVVEADYNIAYLYYMRGQYTRAIELYQKARERSAEMGDAYHSALCDLDQSELYLELNLVEEGVRLAEAAFAGFERLGMAYEAAKALSNLAVGAGRQGQAVRALELFDKARSMFVGERNAIWPALIDTYRALVLQDAGRYFEARRCGEEALAVFDAMGLANKAALCELVLARVHLRTGELIRSRTLCRAALGRLLGSEEAALTYRGHFLLGQVEEALGNHDEAFEAYGSAHARLETLRSHLEQDELKIGFLKDKLAVYEGLVWLTLGRGAEGDAERALLYIEQAKSRSLADLLAFRAQELPARTPMRSRLVERVQDLRQQLNWYYRKIDLAELRPERHSRAELERLRRDTRDRESELLRTLRDTGTSEHDPASLNVAVAPDLAAIRSTIPAGTVIVEYYQARGTILAAVLDRSRLDIVPLTPATRARHLLRLLQFQLAKFRLGPEYVRTFEGALQRAVLTHLHDLHQELVEPLLPLLQADHLVVVPHDFLHYVPFHALYDGRRHLIDQFTMSQAPSATVHHLCRMKSARWREESLVLGVPDAATPGIAEEARSVANALPGARLFLGEEASASRLRSHGRHSRFVHVATHGMFRYDNPMFSALQLGGARLSLFDLYRLELEAELVTLSGCGTGLNVVEGGDELMGLVRGLLYAGAHAALVTLWDVNDGSTCAFMQEFYARLKQGSGKASALRLAMQAIRKEYPHAYHWAPFVLVGAEGN